VSKFIRKIFLGACSVVAALFLLFLGTFAVLIFRNISQNMWKEEIQTIEVPARNTKYVLLTDMAGFDDRSWYVYEMALTGGLTEEMKKGHSRTGVLFWNYAEAADHKKDPRIEIRKDRYLVFVRGGFCHSLYDLESHEVLVNDESPWHSFLQSEQYAQFGDDAPPGEPGTGMDVWVKANIHEKIEGILKGLPGDGVDSQVDANRVDMVK
jgi:hypothetical protein